MYFRDTIRTELYSTNLTVYIATRSIFVLKPLEQTDKRIKTFLIMCKPALANLFLRSLGKSLSQAQEAFIYSHPLSEMGRC